jgi:hypothetical protein
MSIVPLSNRGSSEENRAEQGKQEQKMMVRLYS